MHFLKSFYLTSIKYQLTNKFNYQKISKLPKIKKIVLNFGSKKINTKELFSGLLAFELIANQKGLLTTVKNASVTLQIRKGIPSGCKLTLQKNNLFRMFADLLLTILPKKKQNKFNLNKNSISYKIWETFIFFKLETQYYFFNSLPNLNLTVVTTTVKSEKELIFFYKLFYFL